MTAGYEIPQTSTLGTQFSQLLLPAHFFFSLNIIVSHVVFSNNNIRKVDISLQKDYLITSDVIQSFFALKIRRNTDYDHFLGSCTTNIYLCIQKTGIPNGTH